MDIVSYLLKILGLQVIIRDVFELPPKDYYNILVNFELRYGTCYDLPSVKALITYPRTVKDLLIFWASFIVFPYAPVLLILSEPARSTR